jgi:hypothetical protein
MKEEILDITKKLYHNHLTPELATDLLLRLFNVLPKTRKCDWCDKSKSVEQGYWLGKFENSKKDWFICVECNLKHDVV